MHPHGYPHIPNSFSSALYHGHIFIQTFSERFWDIFSHLLNGYQGLHASEAVEKSMVTVAFKDGNTLKNSNRRRSMSALPWSLPKWLRRMVRRTLSCPIQRSK
jgi:hypothetical protein